ncbi:hypothetical protein ALC57_16052, partial [Trachymyrmex cornetzi]
RDDPTVLAVLGMIAINPRVSTRQIERELGIPKSTSHRILTTHNFHPYHITLTQQLTLNIYTFYNKDCRHCLKISIWIPRQRMFFQDGAPAHWSRRIRNHLDLTFPGRWIGRGGPVSWCPRSPDLSSLDIFLWGYLKNVAYSKTPTTRENMMERITLAYRSIPRNIPYR